MGDTKSPHQEFSDKIFFDINVSQLMGYLNAHRRIIVSGEIFEKKTKEISMMLLQLDFDKIEPITLLIDSNGGDVRSSYFLMDVINGLNSPVDGLVIGDACSMAVDILQMCRKRQMLPNARLLCHFTRHGFKLISDTDSYGPEDAEALQSRMLENKKKRETMYARRTGQSIEAIQKLFRLGEVYNLYLGAEQALKENLIDEIATDFKFIPRKPKTE